MSDLILKLQSLIVPVLPCSMGNESNDNPSFQFLLVLGSVSR